MKQLLKLLIFFIILKFQSSFSQTGNVGIGTTTPTAPLHIHSNQANFKLTNPTFPLYGLGFTLSNTDSKIGNVDGIPLSLITSNLDRLTIDGEGKVGIGTTSPLSNLHIHSSPSNPGVAQLKLTNTNFSTDGFNFTLNPVEANIGSYQAIRFNIITNNIPRFSVKENEYVGIGKAMPFSTLEIQAVDANSDILKIANNSGVVKIKSLKDGQLLIGDEIHNLQGFDNMKMYINSTLNTSLSNNIYPTVQINTDVLSGNAVGFYSNINTPNGPNGIYTAIKGSVLGNGTGVLGIVNNGFGVYGQTTTGYGGRFISNSGTGLFAKTSNGFAFAIEAEGNIKITGLIEQEASIVPTLNTNWSNFGGSFANAAYYRDKNNIIHLRGTVQNNINAVGNTILTLPIGMRPMVGQLIFTCWNNNALGRIDITSTGNVVLSVGSNGWVSLDGIAFKAE